MGRNRSGLFRVAVSEDGFCAVPSIVKGTPNSESRPLYWKVTNPTLAPSHLQGSEAMYINLVDFVKSWKWQILIKVVSCNYKRLTLNASKSICLSS